MKRIYRKIETLASNQSYVSIIIFTCISAFVLTKGLSSANEHYALSKYPPSLFPGQLAFSPEKVKGWYQFLIDNNTLDVYITTQYIDFIFILGLMATIFFTQLLIAKLNPTPSKWYAFAISMCFWGPLLATADIWENIVTLTMLNNPTNFSPWLAYLASSFTVWKLSWAITGCSLVIIQFISLLVRKIKL
jgi:hypothetical protein